MTKAGSYNGTVLEAFCDLRGVIAYDDESGFRMVEDFIGNGAILEAVLRDLKADGCKRICIEFYDEESEDE